MTGEDGGGRESDTVHSCFDESHCVLTTSSSLLLVSSFSLLLGSSLLILSLLLGLAIMSLFDVTVSSVRSFTMLLVLLVSVVGWSTC